jgi:hypothetical protein
VNRRQGNQKPRPPCTEPGPGLGTKVAPLFQHVLARRIVVHAAIANQVRLGGVEVAAGRIHAQRPARVAVLLPGRQTKGTAEELGNAGVRNVVGCRGSIEESGIRNVGRDRGAR